MLLTDRTRLRGSSLEEAVSRALDGGVSVVQLREKDLSGGDLYDLAVTIRAVTRGRALFLVNDRFDVALAAGADGVHLPEHSVPVMKVRDFAGDVCIIGCSVHSVEAALRAEAAGADYVVVGAVYKTASHPGQEPGGIELVRTVAEAVRVPVVAVGGISAENAAAAVAAGADGVAVIGAIMDAGDPQQAAARLRRALDEAHG